MNNDEGRKAIQAAMHKIQMELKAPKGQFNNFGKYKYRSLEDIIAAVKKVMPEGVTLNFTDEPLIVGEWHYIRSVATLALGENCYQSVGIAREPLEKKGYDVAQISGACSSYARKYALSGLVICDDNPDEDAGEGAKGSDVERAKPTEKPKPEQVVMLTTDQITHVSDLLTEVGYTHEQLLTFYKIESWGKCPASYYSRIVAALEKKKAGK